jgi:hypothetical protein
MAAVLSHTPTVQFHPLLVAVKLDRLCVHLFCFINATGRVMSIFLVSRCERVFGSFGITETWRGFIFVHLFPSLSTVSRLLDFRPGRGGLRR